MHAVWACYERQIKHLCELRTLGAQLLASEVYTAGILCCVLNVIYGMHCVNIRLCRWRRSTAGGASRSCGSFRHLAVRMCAVLFLGDSFVVHTVITPCGANAEQGRHLPLVLWQQSWQALQVHAVACVRV